MNRAVMAIAAVLMATLVAGCTRTPTSLTLISYQDVYFPESFDLSLDDATFYRPAPGAIHISGTREFRAPGESESIRQSLLLRVFWTPVIGKITSARTALNTTISYVVASDFGVAIYRGTGFTTVRPSDDGTELGVHVESGRLRLDSTSGNAPDVLGAMRLVGGLTATEDEHATLEVLRHAEHLEERTEWPSRPPRAPEPDEAPVLDAVQLDDPADAPLEP